MIRLPRGAGLLERLGRDDGAVAVLASVLMLVSLAASAMAIDVGALVFEQREMRKVADLAALDAVLVLTDRSSEFADPQAGAEQIAAQSAARNGFLPQGTLVTRVGRWTGVSFLPGVVGANAVEVTGTDQARGFQFASGSRQVSATAVATTENWGGIAIGTGLVELNSSESALVHPLFSALLGTSVSLTAVHYQGLAGLDVPMGALAAQLGLGAGGVDEFLAADVTVARLARAMIDANPEMTTVTAEALSTIANLTTGRSRWAFPMGDILDVAADLTDGNAFGDAEVNALTLLMAGAQAANKNNAVDLNVAAQVPSLLTGQTLGSSILRVAVIEPPQIAIGPARQVDGQWVTVARSAQLRLRLLTRVHLDKSILDGLEAATMELPLYVGAAQGTAALTSSSCANDPTAARVGVDAATGGATVRVAKTDDTHLLGGAEPSEKAHLVRLRAKVLLATVDAADVFALANATVASGGRSMEFTGPFDWTNVQSTGAVSDPKSLLDADLKITKTLLDSSLAGWVLSAVDASITNVITPLAHKLTNASYDAVAQPALSLLGANLASADVTAWNQTCGPRVLVQ